MLEDEIVLLTKSFVHYNNLVKIGKERENNTQGLVRKCKWKKFEEVHTEACSWIGAAEEDQDISCT